MAFLAGQILTADALNEVFGDTGVLVDSLDITPNTGWALTINEHRVIGKILRLRIRFRNDTGAAITATGTGNLSPDVLMGTINDVTKRPVMEDFIIGQGSATSGCVQIAAATGQITLTDLHSTSAIAASQTVEFATTYTIP